ncbi:EPIDERMAL PATTERNING FACTOR-like protein 2 [Diospyros lotus]|uniref:EPIDERMAL PATTERNING FACTOR-like protein 2 n=1 Tax=Diospyros lotus TaxID=55363 RepID=UPI0022586383|nr:EPIDERMAL PATTERNING FACTOR-like protein 2 [Diospyros lotus]
MGSGCNSFRGHKLHHLTMFLLLIATWTQFRFITQGGSRTIPIRPIGHYNQEGKALLNSQIGSRPPRCQRRCSSCGHCEAIQVPTEPQVITAGSKNSSAWMSRNGYASRDDSSDYKPISWKCKCGNSIFNP